MASFNLVLDFGDTNKLLCSDFKAQLQCSEIMEYSFTVSHIQSHVILYVPNVVVTSLYNLVASV